MAFIKLSGTDLFKMTSRVCAFCYGVGKRNHVLNVEDRAFAVCQQLSVGFRAISFSKELNSMQGGRFNKKQDVWLRLPSRTKRKAKKSLPCSVYFCQTMVDEPQRYELLLSHC